MGASYSQCWVRDDDLLTPAGAMKNVESNFEAINNEILKNQDYWHEVIENLGRDLDYNPNVQTCDILIVGAGFSGFYMADKLRTQHPDAQIILVEKSGRVGGRLLSSINDFNDVKDELGGMRIFPHCMPELMKLVERFNLHLQPLPLGDSGNIFHSGDEISEGSCVCKKNAKVPGEGKFAGRHHSNIATEALANYKSSEHWVKCNGDAYACEELRNLNLTQFFKKYAGASDEEVRCWFDFSGYNLSHNNVQASIFIADGELYGSDITHHNFVKEGFMQVVLGLRNACGIEPDLNTSIASLRHCKDGTIVATTSDGKAIKSKQIVLALTALQLSAINGIEAMVSPERLAAVRGSKPIPLFKCFLDFPKPWWTEHGFQGGKSTSATGIRQCHYYDQEDLLLYSSDGDGSDTVGDRYASTWEVMKITKGKRAVYEAMFKQVKEMHVAMGVHEDHIVEPNWEHCVHAYWPSGSHKWLVGVDVNKSIELITDGASDSSGVYIVGDAFSKLQGWVQGAISTADVAVEQMAKQKGHRRVSMPVFEYNHAIKSCPL